MTVHHPIIDPSSYQHLVYRSLTAEETLHQRLKGSSLPQHHRPHLTPRSNVTLHQPLLNHIHILQSLFHSSISVLNTDGLADDWHNIRSALLCLPPTKTLIILAGQGWDLDGHALRETLMPTLALVEDHYGEGCVREAMEVDCFRFEGHENVVVMRGATLLGDCPKRDGRVAKMFLKVLGEVRECGEWNFVNMTTDAFEKALWAEKDSREVIGECYNVDLNLVAPKDTDMVAGANRLTDKSIGSLLSDFAKTCKATFFTHPSLLQQPTYTLSELPMWLEWLSTKTSPILAEDHRLIMYHGLAHQLGMVVSHWRKIWVYQCHLDVLLTEEEQTEAVLLELNRRIKRAGITRRPCEDLMRLFAGDPKGATVGSAKWMRDNMRCAVKNSFGDFTASAFNLPTCPSGVEVVRITLTPNNTLHLGASHGNAYLVLKIPEETYEQTHQAIVAHEMSRPESLDAEYIIDGELARHGVRMMALMRGLLDEVLEGEMGEETRMWLREARRFAEGGEFVSLCEDREHW